MEMHHLDADGSDTPPPEATGFGLLTTPVIDGRCVVLATFMNRTSQPLVIPLRNSALLLVRITGQDGKVFDVNSHLPPVTPMQPPLQVDAGTDHTVVYPFDPAGPPYNGAFKFDPANAPYLLSMEVNSDAFAFSASAALAVPVPT